MLRSLFGSHASRMNKTTSCDTASSLHVLHVVCFSSLVAALKMEHTQSELSLPKFLQPSLQPSLPTQTPRPVPLHAVYNHEQPLGISQVLWWPWRSLDGSVTPRTVLLFIPGACTPFSPFLTALFTCLLVFLSICNFSLFRRPRATRFLCAVFGHNP